MRESKGLAQKEQPKQNDKAALSALPFIPLAVRSSSTGKQIR